MERAIQEKKSFNVIQLSTMFKVDVFVAGDSPFEQESFRRSRTEPIGRDGSPIRVSTPEDTVLHKLIWYRKGGEFSSRQWEDVLGVLKVQAGRLDRDYLRRWADELEIADLLRKAMAEAGIDW